MPVIACGQPQPADSTADVPPAAQDRPALRRAQYRVPGPGGDGECVVLMLSLGVLIDGEPYVGLLPFYRSSSVPTSARW